MTDGPGATQQVPIASVAKLMTAYMILQDQPLSGGGSGPDITVEPSEAAAYPSQARDGNSLVAVAAGEAVSECQALEALLLPSADNMAWILERKAVYRCRHGHTSAAVPDPGHPKNAYIREDRAMPHPPVLHLLLTRAEPLPARRRRTPPRR